MITHKYLRVQARAHTHTHPAPSAGGSTLLHPHARRPTCIHNTHTSRKHPHAHAHKHTPIFAHTLTNTNKQRNNRTHTPCFLPHKPTHTRTHTPTRTHTRAPSHRRRAAHWSSGRGWGSTLLLPTFPRGCNRGMCIKRIPFGLRVFDLPLMTRLIQKQPLSPCGRG